MKFISRLVTLSSLLRPPMVCPGRQMVVASNLPSWRAWSCEKLFHVLWFERSTEKRHSDACCTYSPAKRTWKKGPAAVVTPHKCKTVIWTWHFLQTTAKKCTELIRYITVTSSYHAFSVIIRSRRYSLFCPFSSQIFPYLWTIMVQCICPSKHPGLSLSHIFARSLGK